MGVPPFSRKLVCAVLIGIPLLLCLRAEGITAEGANDANNQMDVIYRKDKKAIFDCNASFAAVVPGNPGLDMSTIYPDNEIATELGYSTDSQSGDQMALKTYQQTNDAGASKNRGCTLTATWVRSSFTNSSRVGRKTTSLFFQI
eukprot:GHVU01034010.1.p1 GENE.GHVU01034010.1~~GHVU01034010.1.p1  ORF type:complete len:144 (+),score=10.33 GHVU01034010.1:511-942(+)